MKRKIFLFILVLFAAAYPQENHQLLSCKIDSIYSDEYFESTLMALDIYDLTAGKNLYKKSEKMLLHPASNMKIITSAAGLFFLDTSYQFTTSLKYSGQVINGILYGDLYVIGGLDPDFTSDDLDSLISIIKADGIKEITGNLYGDTSIKDSLFWGNGWMWDDDPSTDAPYLSALNINDNAVGVIVNGTKPGEKASVQLKPESSYFHTINNTITVPSSGRNNFKIDRDWINRNNTIVVKGDVVYKKNVDTTVNAYVNVFNPASYFLTLFKEALLKKGIKFTGTTYIKTSPEYAIQLFSFNRPYDSVIVNLNKTSDNLSAEMTLYSLAAKYFNKPASAKNGIKMIDSLIVLCGLDPSDYRIVDGSGVSHYNLVTAQLLLSILKYIYYEKRELFYVLYNSFPIAGVDGTLEDRMKEIPAENNVHAKTGTLSGVSTLSGYVHAANGNLIAFSIMIQNFAGGAVQARNIQNKICEMLAGYK